MATYSDVIPTRLGYYVYRLWAADGACLYVGCCGERRPRRVSYRLGAHRSKDWWPDVARIDVATLTCPAEVIEEERTQVWQLRPVRNKMLQGQCPNGHDLTRPGALYQDDKCARCRADTERSRSDRGVYRTPERRRSNAATMRRSYRRRRASAHQAALW